VPDGVQILSATTSTPEAVRYIEFLVDGLPVGICYDAPYQVNWLSDGAIHNVEVRAYNMWASQVLTLSHTIEANSLSFSLVRMGRRPKFGVYHINS